MTEVIGSANSTIFSGSVSSTEDFERSKEKRRIEEIEKKKFEEDLEIRDFKKWLRLFNKQ